MKFQPLPINGAFSIQMDEIIDNRGFFARRFCEKEFKQHHLITKFPQWSLSFNTLRGTLRGMHYSTPPYAETKLICCNSGSLFDVLLDLRRDSPTYLQWTALELTHRNRIMLYIPEGIAHGFQTLEDRTEISYYMSASYNPEYAKGVRWNDKSFQMKWPISNPILSTKDSQYPDYIL